MTYNSIHNYDDFPDITTLQEFVLKMTSNKKEGTFVEIGAFHSQLGSNTHILEKHFSWKGVAFDIEKKFAVEYNQNRINPCILTDAVNFNYQDYFRENNFPKQIDFLQIDIDNGFDDTGCEYNTTIKALLTLIGIPLNHYRFSVIAFEHETLMNFKNSTVRDAQREILSGLGYVLVKRWSYEDWWVDPKVVSRELYQSEFQQIAV
jgi:hypothetical protein